MPIEFRCTGCDKLLRTGDHTPGLPAKCPECGTLQTIPNYDSELNIAPKGPPQRKGPQSCSNRFDSLGDDNAGAIVSLLLGITALMTCCCLPLAFPVALIGLVVGIRTLGSKNRGLAIAGTIFSLLGLLSTLGITFALFFSL